jgi:bifunctional DNA-binding transcriptional regulator/antitoxin component of YhaV-PrlF toxin-antitoxin module
MTTLTVTAKGQVTLRQDVLQHLGVQPGENIELELLPNGRGLLRAALPPSHFEVFLDWMVERNSKDGEDGAAGSGPVAQ